MIAQLTGILAMKSPEYAVIDVQGVGYGVFITLNTFYDLPEIGEKIRLQIYTYVREDALKLYGFLTSKERLIFEQLIGVNKVGPKLARNILSKLSVDQLELAILQTDAGLIHTIPGIGEKTAQRLVLELKDKIGRCETQEARMDVTARIDEREILFSDAVSALMNLGYSQRDSQKVIRSCLSSYPAEELNLKALIKYSLERLSG